MGMVNLKVMGTLRRLLMVSKKYWPTFLIGIIATLILSMSDAGIVWLIKPIINKGFIDKDNFFIRWLPILIVFIFALRSVAGFSSNYFIARVARSVVMDFRRQIFRHLLKLPAKFYDQHPSGKLLSIILYNVEQIAQASSDILVTLMREASLAVGLVVVMFVINWRLSLIFIIIVPMIAWGLRVSSRRLRQLSSRVQNSVAEVSHIANEGIEAYRVIRLFSGENYEANKFDVATRENRHQELKVEITNSIGTAIIQLLISIPLAVILFFATFPAFHVSAGSFASIISAVIMLVRPMRRITELNNFMQKGMAGADSIFTLLDEPAEKNSGDHYVARVAGDICFKDVTFSYANTTQCALQQVNFSVKAGQTVAIVGPSGGGKSTIASLLPRFYDVIHGEILIDGININDFNLKELRNQFSLVSQHTVLFNDTVARNIAYAQEGEIDQARLLQAAQSANALEFIQRLAQGFDTIVGEQGLLLSGGQRQRIAIARAIYKQAPILILDEATSALDTQSERQIQAALTDLMQQCTTVVIAHRLSTIENADHILVVNQGRIAEQGQHQALLLQNGIYAELYRMQFNEVALSAVDQ